MYLCWRVYTHKCNAFRGQKTSPTPKTGITGCLMRLLLTELRYSTRAVCAVNH